MKLDTGEDQQTQYPAKLFGGETLGGGGGYAKYVLFEIADWMKGEKEKI